MKEIKFKLDNISLESNKRIYILVSEFNSLVTKQLLEGANDCFEQFGINNITVVWVPGAFEMPVIASLIEKKREEVSCGIICLGAVIKGDTNHFDFVANQNASGIMTASLNSGIPIVYGVLTTDTLEQALLRAGSKAGNKGYDSALTLLKTLSVINQLGI